MSNQGFYFNTWDEMYYVQAKQAANKKASRQEIDEFQKAFSERTAYLVENDEAFRKDYQDYIDILTKKETALPPEAARKKKIMNQIDAACKPLSDDPVKAAKQKLVCANYEKRLKENHQKEAAKEGLEILNVQKKKQRVTIGEMPPESTDKKLKQRQLRVVPPAKKTIHEI